ncbi:zinc finger BED domain-containing 4-like, partial [Brachionus plicatilis]
MPRWFISLVTKLHWVNLIIFKESKHIYIVKTFKINSNGGTFKVASTILRTKKAGFESALLLSPGSKRKNEERRDTICVYENCSKFYAESTSTRVLANHLKVEHNVTKPSFEDSDSEFENITSPKVIRVSEQSRITDLFLTFLINNIQAFMLADDPDFKRFIYSLNNKKTVREKIKLRYEICLNNIKEMLKSIISKIHVTIDIWTSHCNEPYMSVTVHFVTNNWKLTSMLLNVFYFPHPHDAIFILENLNR